MSEGATVIADHEIAEAWKAQILAWLYERRPRKQDFTIDDLEEATGLCPADDPDDFFEDVLDWLVEEGLIRAPKGHRLEGQVLSVQLTAKAQGLMQKAEEGALGKIATTAGGASKSLVGKVTSAAVDFAFAALRSQYGT